MQERSFATIDGNEAAARVAYKATEVSAIYPITPSSPMGELSDAWAASGRPNLWGAIPKVVEMQSEAGAAGAVHGALLSGSLATTFTASQGLLLMIPNMYKIAGELTPCVIHVAARAVATHALSIFGDHSDVMAVRSTGFAMLAAGSVQEAHDLALVAHSATLRARVPFVHFFDGFRTSHELAKIELLDDDDMRSMLDDEALQAHRNRRLTPDRPTLRGSAQNPDVFFQSREAVNPFYSACAGIVRHSMEQFARRTGRQYNLFDYVGAADAERVIVIMGSGAETAHECTDALTAQGEKVGIVKVRLFRPFDVEAFARALPPTLRSLAVLDRTKEPGAVGEPLYQDVVTALHEATQNGSTDFKAPLCVIGGRYGLSSKEFTPGMVRSVFDELRRETPKNHFTVGIRDDVSHTNLEHDAGFSTENDDAYRALFFGLGSDGTVGANKNSIQIIGEHTSNWTQGYFEYDSKKAGSVTVSHLRFGATPIRSTYLIRQAHFVGCHHPKFVGEQDILASALEGGVFLLNTPASPDSVWETLPKEAQRHIIEKRLRFYVIDAFGLAREIGVANRINTIMQTCFFAVSDVIPREKALEGIRSSIEKTYGKKGRAIVAMNLASVDRTLSHLHEVTVPSDVSSENSVARSTQENAPDFVRSVTAPLLAGQGDALPVSALPCDGTFPTATALWEKRGIAQEIPIWDADICVQCGKCAIVCPHAAIRSKVYAPEAIAAAPSTFVSNSVRGKDFVELGRDWLYTIQVAPDDCTGCGICVEVCPAKSKQQVRHRAINMQPYQEHAARERDNFEYFLQVPEVERAHVKIGSVRGSQLLQPLFEFSGACAGCGETPYLKLLSQLFGDRAVIANATGCSSIYGGNLPTTPWSQNAEGRGPAWANSLFEDNAEFGLGIRTALDQQADAAGGLLEKLRGEIGDELATALLQADQRDEPGIYEQRERVEALKSKLSALQGADVEQLRQLADALVKKSLWLVGGDGWAYDIGFGGLDHALASGRNINILVLDTEVYSNTGGQKSKSTPRAAVAKFASDGKALPKKDLGLFAMAQGHVYVAGVAMGANEAQTLRSFLEAEAFEGPSLIIAYSHCIAHGINMRKGMHHQKLAVQSGHWPLFRFNPKLAYEGQNPMRLDSKAPSISFEQYAYSEVRYKMLQKALPERARELLKQAQNDVHERRKQYEKLANVAYDGVPTKEHNDS